MSPRSIACWVIAAALAAAACAPSGGGGGGGSDLTGTWSGQWVDIHQSSPLFAHPPSGTITVQFTESGGTVSGNITVEPDMCNDLAPTVGSSGTITGTLSETTLDFVYDTPIVSGEQPDNGLTKITFTAAFPADPIQGQYDANACSPISLNWDGQFVLNKQ